MTILALNCGSSSVKYQLYDWDAQRMVAKGVVERIGLSAPFLVHTTDTTKVKFEDDTLTSHEHAIELIMQTLLDKNYGVLDSIDEILAVGHRVVHGGEMFKHSTLIDDEVIRTIEELSVLAPLHNPPNLAGITAARHVLPQVPQVGIFDTAFHQSMPDVAYNYALPREWYTEHHVRRYGFHGTSHLYVSKRAALMLGKPASECNLITMHIGNGVSHTAIRNGLSVDTSMGFTPLEGAVMGTRCGDVDPAIPLYMQTKLGLNTTEIEAILNKKSGLLGITGRFVDRRDIQENALNGDDTCRLALSMEAYRIKKYIGMYYAVLGRVDALVFTAGVGENSAVIREMAVEGLESLGILLDPEKNRLTSSSSGEVDISSAESKVRIFVIPTNEELVFVEDVVAVLKGTYTDHMSYPYTFSRK